MFIDTHAHLNFKAFKNDYAQAIERALGCDAKKIIIPSSNLETSKKAVKIAKEYENIYAAVGLHPIHIDPSTAHMPKGRAGETFNEEEYLKLAKSKKVVAIGETGLDYYHAQAHDRTNAELQKEVFRKHLNLATRLNLPVIIHCREAGDEVISILTGQNPLPRGVFHCFSEDWSYAQVILEMGFYLSFTGIITFTKNQETFEVIKNTPLEKILSQADIITLHVPLTSSTEKMINARTLATMKPEALLINTSRGRVIDEPILLEALKEKWIGGATLDVFAKEPISGDHPFTKLGNVVLSPHIGAMTQEAGERLSDAVARQVRDILQGRKPECLINTNRNQ